MLVIVIVMLFGFQFSVIAQSNYTFTPSIGSYSSISGTEVTSVLSDYTPIDIGFTFVFDGVSYTKVIPSKWGWLSFNSSMSVSVGNSSQTGLTSTEARPLIGTLFDDNGTTSSSKARYELTGTAPNRIFTFEWYDWRWHWYTTNEISVEIKLYETTNKIECIYHPIAIGTTFYEGEGLVGLAFANKEEFLSLSDFSSSPAASFTVESNNFFAGPADNQVYTFTPNTVKAAPTNQCTNLTSSNVADNIRLNWTDATGGVVPDGYLVMASKTNSFTDPINGSTIVQDNDLNDGQGVVKVYKGQQSYYGWKNVESSTNYYFRIYAYTNGGNLVAYNNNSVPTTQITLTKSAPGGHVSNVSIANNAGNFNLQWTDYNRFGSSIDLSGLYRTGTTTYGRYLDCGDASSLNIMGDAISLEAWLKPSLAINDIIRKENSTGGYRLYTKGESQICFGLYIGGSWNEVTTPANTLVIGNWSHVCATYDGTTQSIYINGALVASKATTGNITTSTSNLLIGASNNTFKNCFDGQMDEIAIWSVARSQANILNDMDLKLSGSETGLAAYYKCDHNINDLTLNANNATSKNFSSPIDANYSTSNTSSDVDGYLIQASLTNSFPSVVDGVDFATGNDLTDGNGVVKVAQGVQSFSGWTNINVSSSYYFRIIPYSNAGANILYYTVATIPLVSIKPAPTNHVTNFTANGANCNIVLNWTDAIGAQIPEGYVILASTSPSMVAPTSGSEITVDNNLSDGWGAVKVLSGLQTFSGWTGFVSGTTYYFNIYPYTNSGAAISYKTDATVPQVSGSIVIYSEPTNHATSFTAINNGLLTINWVDAIGMPSLLANALNFDGSNDYVICSGSQNPVVFTAEAWYTTAVTDDEAIVSTLNEGGGTGFEIHSYQGKPVVTLRNSGSWLDILSPTVLAANTWNHVALTYDGSTAKLYVNGQLMNSASLAAVSYAPGSNAINIGRRSSGPLPFNGSIDEVRVWNIVRSQTEIQNSMNNELVGAESGLLSYYKFNQGIAGGANGGTITLNDATTNHFDGTLTNFALTGTTSNWINPGQAPAGYLIKASTTDSFIDPVDGTDVAIDNDLSDDNAVVKVAQGTQTYSSFAGTNGNTTYYFKMWPYTNAGNYVNYKTDGTVPTASISYVKTTPVTHVSNLTANNNNKTINLNWTDAKPVNMGNDIALDGTDDYVAVPALGNSITQLTIEAWINAGAFSSGLNGLFNTDSWVDGSMHYQFDNGSLKLNINGGNDCVTSFVFQPNQWYHTALTYSTVSGKAIFYVNGEVIQSFNLGILKAVNLTTSRIGGWAGDSRYFNGKIDEYRIWNKVRTQAEIAANMYNELSASETGLFAYYKFDQGIENGTNTGLTAVTDASGLFNHGTLTNSALMGSTSNWVSFRADAPDGYLIKASKTNSFTDPVNGTVEADDNDLSDGIGAVNVLAGVQGYNGWANFTDTTAYYYKVYSYSNSGAEIVYNSTPTVPWVKDSTGIDQFKEISAGISDLVNGKSKWADYDNDGDLDLLVFGSDVFAYITAPINTVTKLYQNNGNNVFAEVSKGFINISDGDAAWGDCNNDGLLDLIITGVTQYESNGKVLNSVTKLYNQLPDHSFEAQNTIVLPTLAKSAVAWGDYDNDGDLDILISGINTSPTPNENFAKIYRNNGDNSFTAQSQIAIEAIYNGSVAWGDYNKDGFLDFMITGDSNKGLITKIYKNNQNNFFFEQNDIEITGVQVGTAVWGDYDNDGDLDILLNGSKQTSIYKNNYPTNSFTQVPNLNLTATSYGNAKWGDINNDGLMDIVMTGDTGEMSYSTTKIFLQNPDHTFSKYSAITFKAGGSASMSLADYDGDNDLDLFITGHQLNPDYFFSALYQNNLELDNQNSKPSAPVGLEETFTKHMVLSWNAVSGDVTPSQGLSYNIRIGKTSGGNEVISSMSDNSTDSGFRKVVSLGNCQQNTFKILNLPPSTGYFWSVQAIDNAYIGGNFSDERTFDIDTIPASGLTITKISETEVKLKWTRGNGNRCAVFCIVDSSSNSAMPVMKQKYIHSSTFAQGENINSTGWYCVYNGLIDSVIVNGLSNNTTFTAQIIEYVFDNTDAPIYFRQTSPNNDDWGIFSTGQYSEQSVSNIEVDCENGQWADFNKDGYIDYVFNTHSLPLTQPKDVFYAFNNGDNVFVKKTSLGVAANTTIKIADFNSDEYYDLIITDRIPNDTEGSSYTYSSYLRLNNHSGDFYGVPVSLPVLFQPSIDLADFDNDGYIDIAMCGRQLEEPTDFLTKIYHNNQDSTFTEVFSWISSTVVVESISWGDYDNDGYSDFLLNGRDSSYFTKVFKNLGNDLPVNTPRFQEVFHIERPAYSNSYWKDADDDGDLDIVINGLVYANNYPIDSFQANGNSIEYTQQWGTADYDNDGDVDYFSGHKIYRNNSIVVQGAYQPNRVPEIPTNLQADSINGKIMLEWSAITTDETPSTDMTFDVRLRKSGETNWFNAPQTSISGFRRTISLGHYKTNYANINLPLGTYEWQVQAIDQGYESSNWSEIKTFTIASYYTADTVCLGDSTSFTDHSAMNEGEATWLWTFGDNTYSALKNPKHRFNSPGKHYVTLSVNSFAFSDTVFVNDTINVSFTATDVCSGLATTIKNTTPPSGLVSWEWNFGDGSPISTNGDIDSHGFPGLGTYNITMTAKGSNLCFAKATKKIIVTTIPNTTLTNLHGDDSFCQGDSVIYSVPLNSNFNYQWQRDGNNISNTSNTLSVKDVSGDYQVFVTNKLAETCHASSEIKTIVVKEVPAVPIITAESGTTFCQGDSVKLNLGSLANVSVNWYKDLGILSSVQTNYVAKETGSYTAKVMLTNGCSAVSQNPVSVQVNGVPSVPSLNYGETTLCQGNIVTFSTNNISGLKYLWKNGNANLNQDTTNQLTVSQTGSYWLQVTNSYLCSAYTLPVDVIVNPVPAIPVINQPSATSICSGDSVLLHINQVNDVTYQWQLNNGNIGTNNNELYVKASGTYKIVLTNGLNCSSPSLNNIPVVVNSKPDLPSVSYGETNFCQGNNVTFSVINNPNYTYQWKNGAFDIPNATNSQLTASETGSYWLKVSNSSECYVQTEAVGVTVNPVPSSPTIGQPFDTNICDGDSVLLKISPTENVTYHWLLNGGNTGYNTYQLYARVGGTYSIVLSNSNNCSAASTNSIPIIVNTKPNLPSVTYGETQVCQGENVTFTVEKNPAYSYQWKNATVDIQDANSNQYVAVESGKYRLQITNSNQCSVQTEPVEVIVNPAPESPVVDQPSLTTICSGDSVLLNISPQENVTYQWLLNGGNTGNSNNQLYAKTSGIYSILITNSYQCIAASTNNIQVTVNSIPAVPSVSYGETSFCKGNSITFSTSNNSGYTYQWKKDQQDIPNAINSQYVANETGSYWLQVTNGNQCSVSTEPVEVEVYPVPLTPVIDQPLFNSFCMGDSVELNCSPVENVTYQWLLNGGTAGDESNQIVVKTGGTYQVLLLNSYQCPSVLSNSIQITVNPVPQLPSVTYGETRFCEGNSVTFSVSKNSSYSYQWKNGTEDIVGATSNQYIATGDGSYWLKVSNSNLCSVETTPVEVIVDLKPDTPIITEENNITLFCPGTEVKLLVDNASSNFNYQWQRSGVNIDGANRSVFEGKLKSGDYSVIVNSGLCSEESDILTLTTKPAPAKPEIFARGPNLWLLGCSNDTAKDYRWYYNGQLITGAKTHLYFADQNLGNYYVEINDGGECWTMSDIINIPSGDIINGIPELFNDAVIIYPNPSSGLFNVSFGAVLPGLITIEVMDEVGKIVGHYDIKNANGFAIEMENAKQGIYFCKIEYKGSVVMKKLVKQ